MTSHDYDAEDVEDPEDVEDGEGSEDEEEFEGSEEEEEEESEEDEDDEESEDRPPSRLRLFAARIAAPPPFRIAARIAHRIRALIPSWVTKALGLRLAGVAVCTLAVATTSMVAEAALFGRFEQRHDQQLEYAKLRGQLAAGTAPVGPADYRGVRLHPGDPIAILAIPAIGVNQVVDEGTSGAVLESGPGHERGTVLPGQVGVSVLMGRAAAYGGPFRYLDQLRGGDRVDVTTGQGVAEYRVLDVRHPGDPQPAAPGPAQGRLTLITASGPVFTPDDQLSIDADLVSDPQPAPAGKAPHPGHAEAAMAGDRQALPDVLAWSGVLALACALAFWSAPRWGRAKTWLVAAPVLLVLGLTLADRAALLLPNLT
jgi:LPXTG-site transpeptidase (sortase) family protein